MSAAKPAAVMPSLAHLSADDFQHVYEPQEDTWLLCDALLSQEQVLRKCAPTLVVEIGPGSGSVCTYLVNLLARKNVDSHTSCAPPWTIACDLNPRAAQATLATARANGAGAVIDAVRCDLVGPLLQRAAGAVDVLLFNPPYVPSPPEEIPLHYYIRNGLARACSSSNNSSSIALIDKHDVHDGASSSCYSTDGRETSHAGRHDSEATDDDVREMKPSASALPDFDDANDPERARCLAAGAWAGGEDGRAVIDRVLPLVPALLSRPCGLMYMIALEDNKWVHAAGRRRQPVQSFPVDARGGGFTITYNKRAPLHYPLVFSVCRPTEIARILSKSGLVTARVAARKAANEHLMVLRIAWRDNPHLAK